VGGVNQINLLLFNIQQILQFMSKKLCLCQFFHQTQGFTPLNRNIPVTLCVCLASALAAHQHRERQARLLPQRLFKQLDLWCY
jgi:hypothetical protein